MLVYVNDLILIRNNDCFQKKFVEALSQKFSLRNLGNLNYFLRIELVPHKKWSDFVITEKCEIYTTKYSQLPTKIPVRQLREIR